MKKNKNSLVSLVFTSFLASCGGGGGGEGNTNNPQSFGVSATVTGLAGDGLSLSLNGAQSIPVATDGKAQFPGRIQDGLTYTVLVATQPANPGQVCSIASGSGTVRGTNVDVQVTCAIESSTSIVAKVMPDASVPAPVVDRIAEIVSTLGSTTINGSLDIPWAPGGAVGPVFALDEMDNVVLAAMGDSKSVSLSFETTAVVLVRLFMGPRNSLISSSEMDSSIRGASEFTSLVISIKDTVTAGLSPTRSAEVVHGINTVIGQLSEAIRQAKSTARLQALVPNRLADEPMPAKLAGPLSSNYLAVLVTGGNGSGGIRIANGMPIYWQASTVGPNGIDICAPGGACGYLEPPDSIYWSALHTWWSGAVEPVSVSGNDWAFNLTLSQTERTITASGLKLIGDAFELVLEALPIGGADGKCRARMVDALTGGTGDQLKLFKDLLVTPVDGGLDTKLRAWLSDRAFDSLETYAVECAWKVTSIKKAARAAFKTFFQGVEQAKLIAGVVDLAVTGKIYKDYWNAAPITVGVCINKDNHQLANCATTFTFDPESLYLGPGASASLPMVKDALDLQQKPTLALVKPEYLPQSDLIRIDAVANTLSAPNPNRIDQAEVQAIDNATGATGQFRAIVVSPIISPRSVVARTLSANKFELTAPDGNLLAAVAQNTRWVITDADNKVRDDFDVFPVDEMSATVRIPETIPSGAYTLTAYCESCDMEFYERATINVDSDIPAVTLSFTTPPDWTGEPNYGLWGVADFGSEGPQCISLSYRLKTTIYRADGTPAIGYPRDTVQPPMSVCMGDQLGNWRLRPDGKYWGLVLSGGITNGRMEHEGTFTFTLPNSRNPNVKPVTIAFHCEVTDTWHCD